MVTQINDVHTHNTLKKRDKICFLLLVLEHFLAENEIFGFWMIKMKKIDKNHRFFARFQWDSEIAKSIYLEIEENRRLQWWNVQKQVRKKSKSWYIIRDSWFLDPKLAVFLLRAFAKTQIPWFCDFSRFLRILTSPFMCGKIEVNNYNFIFPHKFGLVTVWHRDGAFIVTFPKENLFTLHFVL